ncbi:Tellurite resistance protein TehA [Mycolicibacterium rutilum]|uniref:Tellurite resistance protein TehA n=1 Tax=Mycolicibacterium rutilum TaxID=370526 RepID=A0A1H6JU81_MYCRU|nr:tellurite resistance/C4-dicarboxylate transporter family protein [Mycolicibacterium rutilum]SEH62883.1 Tellurite resistance protein TehA [Mycolicibacterium rutilum]
MKPDVFAFVMATGIVSIAAAKHGFGDISLALAVVAAVALPSLAVAAAVSWWRRPLDLTDPDVTIRLYTFVAACAVLDSRLMAHFSMLWSLAVMAAAAWLVVSVLTVRSFRRRSGPEVRGAARGAWELCSVGTSGLVIVLVALAPVWVAAAVWVAALVLYALMTTLILARAIAARLDPRGFEPDAWILMGGLAIATLAGDHLHGAGLSEVRRATVVTWGIASLWIVPLTYFAVRHLQRIEARHFAGVWWAMVFPLGMYSAATRAMAVETGWPALPTISLAFFWIAFAAWVIVVIAGLRMLWNTRVRHLPSRHGLR